MFDFLKRATIQIKQSKGNKQSIYLNIGCDVYPDGMIKNLPQTSTQKKAHVLLEKEDFDGAIELYRNSSEMSWDYYTDINGSFIWKAQYKSLYGEFPKPDYLISVYFSYGNAYFLRGKCTEKSDKESVLDDLIKARKAYEIALALARNNDILCSYSLYHIATVDTVVMCFDSLENFTEHYANVIRVISDTITYINEASDIARDKVIVDELRTKIITLLKEIEKFSNSPNFKRIYRDKKKRTELLQSLFCLRERVS